MFTCTSLLPQFLDYKWNICRLNPLDINQINLDKNLTSKIKMHYFFTPKT